jgi:hypothetical protein
LSTINHAWFNGQLKIERNDKDTDDVIWWLHTADVVENQLMPAAPGDDNLLGLPLSFQIWLRKSNSRRITYKPNISFGIPLIVEEFIAMRLQKIFELQHNFSKISYEK